MRNCYTYNEAVLDFQSRRTLFLWFFLSFRTLVGGNKPKLLLLESLKVRHVDYTYSQTPSNWLVSDGHICCGVDLICFGKTNRYATNQRRKVFFFFFYRVLCSPKWAIRFDFHPKFWRKNKTPEIRVIIGRAFKKKSISGVFPSVIFSSGRLKRNRLRRR